MKKCSMKTCIVPIEQQEFNKNKSRKDGLNTICKICSRDKSREYYKSNSDKHKKNVASRNKSLREDIYTRIYNYLSDKSCVDCGEKDLRVLQFDHRENKIDNISAMATQRFNWDVIQAEIEKCDIRCANCHLIKTSLEQNWFVNKYIEGREAY